MPTGGDRDESGGIPLGHVSGVPVVLSPSWFLMAIVITIGYGGVLAAREDIGSPAGYVGGFLFAVMLGASVLAHEIAHTTASRRLGIPVRRVTLFLLGGVSETTREPESPAEEYLVSVVGPLVSLVLGAVATVAYDMLTLSGLGEALLLQFAFANVLVGVFNLLPGLPLDGGRLLRAAVWRLGGDRLAATRVASTAGKVVAAIAGGVGGLLLMQGGVAGVANAIILFVLALFIWAGAEGAVRGAQVDEGLRSIDVASLARSTLVVPSYLSLGEAVRRAHETGARAIVVADSYGRPSGVVREATVLATPEERRPWVSVAAAATAIGPDNTLPADGSGKALVAAVRDSAAAEFVVVDEGGTVRGVVARADVLAALGLGEPGAGA